MKMKMPVRAIFIAAMSMLGAISPQALPPNLVYITDAPYNAPCSNGQDDAPAIQSAINNLNANGGRIVIPRACTVRSALYISGPVCLEGLGISTSSLTTTLDIEVVHFTANIADACLEKLSIFGFQNAAATNYAVSVENNARVHMRDVRIWGGYFAMHDNGADGLRENMDIMGFNPAGGGVASQGSNWWVRSKIDNGVVPTTYGFLQGPPFPGAGSSENRFVLTDFSGSYRYSLYVDDGGLFNTFMNVQGSVFSSAIQIGNAGWVQFDGTTFGGQISVSAANTPITIANSFGLAQINVTGGNRRCSNNFNITC